MLRGRRLRRSAALREMLREHTLRVEDLVYPLFIAEDESAAGPVPSMPGVKRHFVGRLDGVLDEIARLGLRGVILFGIPARKDSCGSGASDPDGVVCRAIRAIKARLPELVVIADVCLCEYTDHGKLLNLIEAQGGIIEQSNFTDKVVLRYSLRDGDTDPYMKKLSETFSARLKAEEIGRKTVPFEKI